MLLPWEIHREGVGLRTLELKPRLGIPATVWKHPCAEGVSVTGNGHRECATIAVSTVIRGGDGYRRAGSGSMESIAQTKATICRVHGEAWPHVAE